MPCSNNSVNYRHFAASVECALSRLTLAAGSQTPKPRLNAILLTLSSLRHAAECHSLGSVLEALIGLHARMVILFLEYDYVAVF